MLKDSIASENINIIKQAQELVLPYLVKIAQFRKEDPDENRGNFYFDPSANDKALCTYGNTFIRLVLEGVRFYGLKYRTNQHGQPTLFANEYQQLLKANVAFPA